MKKLVIIINGKGGVGKDTLCDFASEAFNVMNISSITPIKEIARMCGWAGDKTARSRKFLSDLKRLVTDYSDYPNTYLMDEFKKFKESEKEILFVHIRELYDIINFKRGVDIPCVTLLVKREEVTEIWGNESDDNAEKLKYDYIFYNNKSLEEARVDFVSFMLNIFLREE